MKQMMKYSHLRSSTNLWLTLDGLCDGDRDRFMRAPCRAMRARAVPPPTWSSPPS